MDDYIFTTLALFALYLTYRWWMERLRLEDLTKNLSDVLKELHEEEYSTESWVDRRGAHVIVLKNSMLRVVFTSFRLCEELTANRFFKDSEKSGANIAYASRCTSDVESARLIEWERQNHLCGRMLYREGGSTKNKLVHDLFSELIAKVKGCTEPRK